MNRAANPRRDPPMTVTRDGWSKRLMQHQEMRVMCRYESARTFAPRIAYDSDSSDY